MGHSMGTLTQKFEIRLDVEKLSEYIADQIIKTIEETKDRKGKPIYKNVEVDEAFFDDYEELKIIGTYDTGFECWYCSATRYEPSEYELEREMIGNTEWILSGLPENIRNLVKVRSVKEDDEDITFHEPSMPTWLEC